MTVSAPAGRLDVVIETPGCMTSASDPDEPELFPASVARNVRFEVPAVVGVPLITPLVPSNVSPAGSVPEVSAHVYPPTPPVAPSVCEYGSVTSPCGREEVVTVTGAFTARLR